MDSALIVSRPGAGLEPFLAILQAVPVGEITVLHTCGEARRTLLEREFDLVIVNAPLRDDAGEDFARFIAAEGRAQVILLARAEYAEAVAAACEEDGVLVVAKPVNRGIFWSTLRLAAAAHNRLRRMRDENSRLRRQIEDIRVIDRAKHLLIARLAVSEEQAHRLIEKQAMDARATRREIAEGILKSYES